MQLFVLALVMGIVGHDWLLKSGPLLPLGEAALAAWMVGSKVFLAGSYALLCRVTVRHLGEARSLTLLHWLDRTTGLYRSCVIGLFFADLAMGGLLALRDGIGTATGVAGGNLIALDEILALLPSLLLLAWAWWCYYPIDRRLREASLIRRIDAGMPIHPLWTRRQFVVTQLRHQVAMVLVPMLFLIAWSELVEWTMAGVADESQINPAPLVQLAGAACIFLFAPVMIRHLWDTTPLPDGQMRRRLMQMCRQHHVGVRELLLWRTFGGMINAAVLGLVRPLRFILLTDGLLEQVPQEQVEAVMAHELAHVRRHHMFWLLTIAMVLAVLLSHTWHFILRAAGSAEPYFDAIVLAGTIVSWIVLFGWVSRRLERQADTFAVQHMAYAWAEAHRHIGTVYVNESSVSVMTEALQHVADLNQMQVNRRSWRHGSITWRQRYLRKLAGQPADQLRIDHQILWIKMLASTAAGLLIAIYTMSWLSVS